MKIEKVIGRKKTNNRNGFKRGSGCYKCLNCGRKTRATGNNDNEHVKMCEQCYEIGGIENLIVDGNYDGEKSLQYWKNRIKELEEEVRAKGGKFFEE